MTRWRNKRYAKVYSSATAGGITTGGVTKIDGGYSVGSGEKTGNYNFWYKKAKRSTDSRNLTGREGTVIHSIVLSDSDFEKAKKNPKLSSLIMDEEEMKASYSTRRYRPKTLNVYNLSKITVDYVLSWICGEVN